jgi:hypothetical protein
VRVLRPVRGALDLLPQTSNIGASVLSTFGMDVTESGSASDPGAHRVIAKPNTSAEPHPTAVATEQLRLSDVCCSGLLGSCAHRGRLYDAWLL